MGALELVAWVAGAYLGVGAVFGALFVVALVGRIDPDATRGSWGFRLAIWPGVATLWPLLALRLAKRGEPRERGPHLDAGGKR